MFRNVPGVFRGCYGGVPGVFRGVPACSGFTDTQFSSHISTSVSNTQLRQ